MNSFKKEQKPLYIKIPSNSTNLLNRNQCHVDDDDKQDSNLLVVPIANMPRTPGGETCQVSWRI